MFLAAELRGRVVIFVVWWRAGWSCVAGGAGVPSAGGSFTSAGQMGQVPIRRRCAQVLPGGRTADAHRQWRRYVAVVGGRRR